MKATILLLFCLASYTLSAQPATEPDSVLTHFLQTIAPTQLTIAPGDLSEEDLATFIQIAITPNWNGLEHGYYDQLSASTKRQIKPYLIPINIENPVDKLPFTTEVRFWPGSFLIYVSDQTDLRMITVYEQDNQRDTFHFDLSNLTRPPYTSMQLEFFMANKIDTLDIAVYPEGKTGPIKPALSFQLHKADASILLVNTIGDAPGPAIPLSLNEWNDLRNIITASREKIFKKWDASARFSIHFNQTYVSYPTPGAVTTRLQRWLAKLED